MPRSRTDNNQSEIVSAARRLGFSVQSLSQVGHGCPDLLLGHARLGNVLVEVKREKKTRSKRQKEWHEAWRRPVRVVRSVDDLLDLLAGAERAYFNAQKLAGSS